MQTVNQDGARLVEQARKLIGEGKEDVARVCVDLALRLDGMDPGARALAGEMALRNGDLPGAMHHFTEALAAHPKNVRLLRSRAQCWSLKGESARAIMDLSEAFLAAPDDYDLLIDLADTLGDANLHGEAALYYKKAADIAVAASDVQQAVDAQFKLGLAMDRLGEEEAALEIFRALASISPDNDNVRGNVIKLLWRMKRREEAAGLLEKEFARGSQDANYLTMYATYLLSANRLEECRQTLAKAEAIYPDNVLFQHLGAALRGDDVKSAPAEYIVNVFDAYADTFDEHLIQGLVYRGPGVMARHIERNLPPGGKFTDCLDLGCGTGLLGVVIRDHVERLTGMDLSGKMLEKAQEKGIYDALDKADIKDYLRAQLYAGHTFDLIAAADVFLYIGELEAVCADIHAALADPGFFIFTVEKTTEAERYKLLPNGRFAYAKSYLESCLREAGFTEFVVIEDQLRMEERKPVEHYIAMASKGRAVVLSA